MLAVRPNVRRWAALLLPLVLVATAVLAPAAQSSSTTPAGQAARVAAAPYVPDYTQPPFNGRPISAGLGPTYGETWCASAVAGSSIANQQGAPLALIPYEAIGCTLEQFQDEAEDAGVPQRMTYSIIGQSDAGRDQYGVVVNALETPEQIERYENWVAYREVALTDPLAAEALVASYGDNVKIPIFVENAIHGDEEEGVDAMMQTLRDLVTLPRGTHPAIDNFLDHAILITIPWMNPDGRALGTRANANGYDMNRDLLVQSQPEVRNNIALQVEWLAPVMLATHGYVNPTLIDGLTKPHNPGLEYDVFAYWNQRRLDANQQALARIGQGITRPVNGPLPVTVDRINYITTATWSGGTATITTAVAHGITAGASVSITGVANSGYNGTFTVATPTTNTLTYAIADPGGSSTGGQAGTTSTTTLSRGFCASSASPASHVCGTGTIAAAPGGLTQSGNTVTVATTAAITTAPVKVADTVVIVGAGDPGYNGGPFRVTSVNSPTSFTFEHTTSGLPASGGGSVQVQTGPNQAEGWDDLGPFYTQTYGAFFGVDGSTLEMCSTCPAPFTGRLGGKTAQYVGFWSSAEFWIANREGMLADQVKIFVRGMTDAARPNCCEDPLVASYGFTEAEHDWMEEYPEAYILPVGDGAQRSDAEANRMAQWLLDNGITLKRLTSDYEWSSVTYRAGSYVVTLDQPMRGLAFTALDAGIDYSQRISQLYAPPGAWSHGLMWGADTVEVPDGAAFSPDTEIITSVDELSGGVAEGEADWYSVTIKGVREQQAIYDLLRDGHFGEIAEAAFVSTSGGPMPAGTLIFGNDPVTVAALEAAGQAAGIVFERNVGVTKPATTKLSEAPRVAILGNAGGSGVVANSDTSTSLKRIFGPEAELVSLVAGPNSIQNAVTDPLLDFDVIYNTGQAYPSATNATARTRLNAFFARGGGYITANVNASLNFLTGSVPALVTGPFTQVNAGGGGGTAIWSNVGGSASPLTGAYPSTDYFYLPSSVSYFNAIPATAVVDGRYLPDMVDADLHGPSAGWVAGLWRNRTTAAAIATNNAPVLIHGNTLALNPANGDAPSRYAALGTAPFSRSDFERIWSWVVQSALWGDLTDEALLSQAITFAAIPGTQYTESVSINPTTSSGLTVQLAASGPCTLSSTTAPASVTINGSATCTITASHPGNANYAAATSVQQVVPFLREDAVATYSGDTLAFTAPGANSVSVNLAAIIQDSSLIASFSDTTPGNLTNATVTFKEGSTVLCGPVAVALIAAPTTTGSGSCSAVLALGAHTITVLVDGYYVGTTTAVVEVISPDGSYVAGAGHSDLGTSAGTYAGTAGSRMHFGFHVKYTPNLKKLTGHSAVVFRIGGSTYEIRSTSIDSLGMSLRTPGGAPCAGPPSSTCLAISDFRAKARLSDITNPSSPVTIANNLTVRVTLTDRGTPGTADSIGVTLTNGATLIFSSSWDGAKTVERLLTGGNLTVH